MITFVPIADLPADVPEKAQAQAGRSLFVWSARYGSVIEASDHIELAIFGLVPTSYLAAEGYIWLVPRHIPGRKVLAQAKRAFFEFTVSLPWHTLVYTEVNNRPAARFARFMGYAPIAEQEGYTFYRRPADGH